MVAGASSLGVLGEAYVTIRATLDQYNRDLADARRTTDSTVSNLSRSFKSIGVGMAKIGGVATGLISGPLALFGKSSLDAFKEQENALAGVEAALKSMGNVAGFTSQQLQDMSSELQSASTFGDEEILTKVTANLLTFGQVQGEVFARAQQSALDLSARLGQDLQSSAIQLGKALNDPVKGLTALSRVGVAFTEEQRDQVKAMIEVGDIAGAQGLILSELERQYSGQAAAMAATTAGQMQQINNAWGDFKEQIGAVIGEVLPPLIEMLKSLVTWLQGLDKDTIKWIVTVGGIAIALGPVIAGLGGLVAGLGALIPVIATVGGAILGLVAAAGPIGLLVAGVTAIVVAWQNWDTIVDIVSTMVAKLGELLGGRLTAILEGLKAPIDAVTGFFDQMYETVVGHSIVPDMVDRIAQEFLRLQNDTSTISEKISRTVANSFDTAGREVAASLAEMAVTGKSTLSDFSEFVDRLLIDLLSQLQQALIFTPFSNAIGAGVASLFAPGTGATYGAGVGQAAGPGAPVRLFASGGVFNRATSFGMAGGGTGVIGEGGGLEAALPLANVGGTLGVSVAGLPPAEVQVNIYGAPPETRTERDQDGGRIDVMLDAAMARNMRPGTATARALKQNFGLAQSTTRR